jgi:putative resolvase
VCVCIIRKLIAISEAAKLLGVHADTPRRWEREGKIKPRRTSGNLRRYDIADIRPDLIHAAPTASRKTVAYARVSSHDQKEDLERQKQVLESYCAAQGWTFVLVADLGSGMNSRKRGLQKLLNQIIAGDVGRIVLNHKDRLLRFGAELVFAICEIKNVEIVILNQGEDTSFEQDLAQDVLEIITVFSARLYGARSKKNNNLIDGLKAAAAAR